MKTAEDFVQHLEALKKRGSTSVTVDIDTVLNLLSYHDPSVKHAAPTGKTTSILVDGGDFSDDGG